MQKLVLIIVSYKQKISKTHDNPYLHSSCRNDLFSVLFLKNHKIVNNAVSLYKILKEQGRSDK